MATQTLRPNATHYDDGRWSRTGGTTDHGVLSDDADGTYMSASNALANLILSLSTYTLAAGERVKQYRARARGTSSSGTLRLDIGNATGSGSFSAYETPSVTLPTSAGESATGWFSTGLDVSDQQDMVDDIGMRLKPNVAATQTVMEVYLDLDVWTGTDAPTVSIAEESGGTVTDTDVPHVESYTASLNDGTPSLYTRQVRVFRDAVYGAGGFDPATETDVEWEQTDIVGGVSTVSGSPDTVQVGEQLANSDTYRAYVRYGKNDVAGQTLWSDWGYSEFALSLTLPDPPEQFEITVNQPDGRQYIRIVTAVRTHDTIERVEVQRRDDSGEWATIRGGVRTEEDNGNAYTGLDLIELYDYDAPRDAVLDYRARTVEGISASGTTITSDWTTADPVVHPNDGTTWIYDVATWDLVGSYRTLRGRSVEPSEMVGVFQPLGRTTAVVVTGGQSASRFMVDVYSSDQLDDVDDVEALATYTGTLLVKWHTGAQDYVRVLSRACAVGDIGTMRVRTWSLQAIGVSSGITADG